MADDKERTDIIIEGSTATWELRAEGDIEGTYTGSFRFRCFLTPTQVLAAGREQRELLGKNPTLATNHEDQLAWSLAQLKQRIISAPPFWTSNVPLSGMPGDISDENIIGAVIDAAVSAESKYKSQIKSRKEDAIKRAKEMAEKTLSRVDEAPPKEEEDGED